MLIQMRLIETTTSRGHSDVTVEASSPEHAADIIARAHRHAQVAGSGVIKLPDGQSVLLDRVETKTELALALLNEAGDELGAVAVPEPRGGRAGQG